MAMTKAERDKAGRILIAVGVAAVALGAITWYQATSKPKPDKLDCLNPVSASAVIVVDHTERVSQQTRDEIVARALAFVEQNVQAHQRVTVFSVTELSRQNLTPSFSRCKPKVDDSRLDGNPRLTQKRLQRDFVEPLVKALSAQPTESKESPVSQALIDVSLTQYLGAPKNSLLVFSDMLEHVPNKFSMYSSTSCRDRESVVKAFRESKKGAQERPTFRNTDIHLSIIPRTDVPKSALTCRDLLWPWFFGDNEGQGAGFTPVFLPGA